jgi:nitrate reductase gamma subunit
MTMFLIFPFTRLVHVWSGFGTLAYVLRPYQLVRAAPEPAGRPEPAAPHALNTPTGELHDPLRIP